MCGPKLVLELMGEWTSEYKLIWLCNILVKAWVLIPSTYIWMNEWTGRAFTWTLRVIYYWPKTRPYFAPHHPRVSIPFPDGRGRLEFDAERERSARTARALQLPATAVTRSSAAPVKKTHTHTQGSREPPPGANKDAITPTHHHCPVALQDFCGPVGTLLTLQ